MRYWVEDETLIIEGEFEAVSTGLLGGWKRVRHIFNHTVRDEFKLERPIEYLKLVAEKHSLESYFGLLTAVPMKNLCVGETEEVTVFTTAGPTNHNERIGTINIIVLIHGDVSDGAMLNAIITATEAKSASLFEMGYRFTGTNTDAVIIAKSGGTYHEYAGPASDIGKQIWKAVRETVKEGIQKFRTESEIRIRGKN